MQYLFLKNAVLIENVVFRGEDAFPIDFGRCGYGYYADDIAGVMVGLGWQNRKIFMISDQKTRYLMPR